MEYVKITEYVRGVVDGRVVVRRPGARIPLELAVKLGVDKTSEPVIPPARTQRRTAAASSSSRSR